MKEEKTHINDLYSQRNFLAGSIRQFQEELEQVNLKISRHEASTHITISNPDPAFCFLINSKNFSEEKLTSYIHAYYLLDFFDLPQNILDYDSALRPRFLLKDELVYLKPICCKKQTVELLWSLYIPYKYGALQKGFDLLLPQHFLSKNGKPLNPESIAREMSRMKNYKPKELLKRIESPFKK